MVQAKGSSNPLKQYWIELVFAVFLAGFAVTFVLGQTKNKERAVQWLTVVRPVLQSQFSRVDTLTRISPSTFRLYATGRLHCYAADINLTLQPRQDVLGVLLSLFTANKESFVMEVPMTERLGMFVFALFPSKKEKKWREELPDLAMAKQRKSPADGFVFLADSFELEKIFTSDVLAALKKCGTLIQ